MPCAEREGFLANLAGEALVSYEGRIAGGAVKPLARLSSPGEKVPLVDQGTRGALMHLAGSLGVLLDAYAVLVGPQETTVAARGVKQAI